MATFCPKDPFGQELTDSVLSNNKNPCFNENVYICNGINTKHK